MKHKLHLLGRSTDQCAKPTTKWVRGQSLRKGSVVVLGDDSTLLVARVKRLTQHVLDVIFEDGTWQIVGAFDEYEVVR